MVSFLSAIATWGPSVYCALGIANTLVTPSIVKSKYGPTRLAKDLLPEVFEKEPKLRQDIALYRVTDIPYASAIGTNFGPAAVVFVNQELASDQKTLKYICKHELSHINTSDGLVAPALAATVSAISTYAVPYLHSCLPWWIAPIAYCVPAFVAANTYNAAMAIFEDRADRFAARHATTEELLAIERFIKGQIEVNKVMRAKYPQFFSADGNTRLALGDINHSSLTDRLEEVRAECRNRKIPIEESSVEQLEKMNNVKKFHENTYSKFFRLVNATI